MYRLRFIVAVFVTGIALDAGAQPPTFARDDYVSDAGARAIVTADFDRNGWLDLAQANLGRNSVTILLNQRDATLTRALDVAVGIGPFALTTGDFNRDAIPDLAVTNADSDTISILIGAAPARSPDCQTSTPRRRVRAGLRRRT